MRSAVILAAALVFGTLVAAVTAPTAAAAESLLTDPKGDVSAFVGVQDASQAIPLPAGPTTDPADLVSLSLEETEEDLVFVLAVADLKGDPSFGEYRITFTWKDSEFSVGAYRSKMTALGAESSAGYLSGGNEDEWGYIAELEVAVDEAAGTLSIVLPKVLLASTGGHAPAKGDSIEDIWVRSRFIFNFQISRTRFEDRMPDGDGAAAFTFQQGSEATGHLLLEVPEPVRVSNGGATTFVYELHVRNAADFDDDVKLEVSNLPDGWTTRVESPQTILAQGETPVYVLASVPFKHEHGGYSSFNVTVTSTRDPAAYAKTRLGVLHTPIPMPAGHHPDLFLHGQVQNIEPFSTLFPWADVYMNTDANHEADAAEIQPNDWDGEMRWWVPLGPSLAMGLDFDTNLTGSIVGSVMGRASGAATVSAELWYYGGEIGEALLAKSDESTVTLDLTAKTPFALTLTPTPESDYIPYSRGNNMYLVLALEPDVPIGPGFLCCIGGTSPSLVTADFKMTLPLNEYHDRLTGRAEGNAIRLVADGPVERVGHPGTTLAYAFNLTNNGAEADTFVVEAAGTDADLATVAPGAKFELGPGETRRITLAVKIPAEAAEGETFEALLVARSDTDPSRLAVGRTTTTASLEVEAQDETDVLVAAQQDEGNDTPALGGLAVALGLAGAALVVGRRR